MTWFRVVGLLLLVPIAMALGLYGAIVQSKRVGKLNSVLPKERQLVSAGNWHFFKYLRFSREYRQAFGVDNLTWRMRIVEGLTLMGILAAAWLALGR